MKKWAFSIVVAMIAVIGLAAFKLAQDGFNIRVENERKAELSGLYLTYENIESNIKLPSIAAGEKYTLKANSKENSQEDFSEASLKLEYSDDKGHIHTEYVIGYFERGYSGKAEIKMKAVDEKGKLTLKAIHPCIKYLFFSRVHKQVLSSRKK